MATILPIHQTAIVNLYTALFNRAPDAAGLAFWAQAYADGAPLAIITESFMRTPEGRLTYPAAQTSTDFVASFYQTVFGRSADAGGLTFWTSALVNAGGAGSDAARAMLVSQIVGTVSASLSTKPDGLTDAQYAQTVADRALFGNKVQVGMYFGVSLGGTDVTLAKQTLALVTADPTSTGVARTFADKGGVVDIIPPVPTLAITRADSVAEITSKFTSYPATIATVDAAGMSGAQLVAVAAAIAKIAAAGISNLNLVLNDADIVGSVTADLLSKAKDAAVVATGGTPAEIAALASAIVNIAAGGINGVLSINQAVAADFLTLMGKYLGTTATVDATGMTVAQQVQVAGSVGKLATGGISNLSLALGATDVTDAVTTALLSKAAGATVDVGGASADELAALVTAIANIAPNGITGTLALSKSTAAGDITALLGKYAAGAASIDATDMIAAQQVAVSGAASKVVANGITNLSLVLGDALVTDLVTAALLPKATGAIVNVTGASTDEITSLVNSLVNIAANGISGNLPVDAGIAATAMPDLFAKYAGITAVVNAAGMTSLQLAAVSGMVGQIAAGGITGMSLALGSTDITNAVTDALLSKATNPSIDATGASAEEMVSLVGALGDIAANGISGALVLDSTISAVNISALLAKYSGMTAMANANGMDTAQLQALASASTKIAANGISNLALNQLSLSLNDTQATALLAKATGASFDATAADDARLALVADNITHVADNGISGTTTLTNLFTPTQLAALLGVKMTSGATVQVNAASMSMAQVAAVGANPSKVDGLSNLPTLDLGDASLTAGITQVLLSQVTGASVLATGASTAHVDTIFANMTRIAAQGISGVLPLTIAQFNATSAAVLDPKLAAMASLAVTGTDDGEYFNLNGYTPFNLSGYTHPVALDGGAGQDDSLWVTGAAMLGQASLHTFTGIETLSLAGPVTAYMSKIPTASKLDISAADGAATVHEITSTQAQNIQISGAEGPDIALYLKDAAAGASDKIKAALVSGIPVNMRGITLPDVEILEFTGYGSGLTLNTINATSLTMIKVTNFGDTSITVNAGHTGSGLVIDARGSGQTQVDISAYATASGASIFLGSSSTGRSGDGSYVYGSAQADQITGGADDDLIIGDGGFSGSQFVGTVATAAADTLTGGGGRNTFGFMKNGSTVLKFDTITDLKLGAGDSSVRGDVLMFENAGGTLTTSTLGDLSAAGSLGAAVSQALSSGSTDGATMLFTFGSDSFLLHNGDGNTTFNDATDFLVKATGSTGVLDVSDLVLV